MLTIVSFLVIAQFDGLVAQSRKIDRTKIEEYRGMGKYNYDEKVPEYEPSWFIKFIVSVFGFLSKGIGLVILIFLVIGLLFLIFYFISKSSNATLINDDEITDIQIEDLEDLQEMDLEKLLNEALTVKNYRLAIRILYLKTLKLLNEKNLIEWKNEKTNYDYIQELSNPSLRPKLDRSTYVYEYVWYGEVALTEDKYRVLEPEFKLFEKDILRS